MIEGFGVWWECCGIGIVFADTDFPVATLVLNASLPVDSDLAVVDDSPSSLDLAECFRVRYARETRFRRRANVRRTAIETPACAEHIRHRCGPVTYPHNPAIYCRLVEKFGG